MAHSASLYGLSRCVAQCWLRLRSYVHMVFLGIFWTGWTEWTGDFCRITVHSMDKIVVLLLALAARQNDHLWSNSCPKFVPSSVPGRGVQTGLCRCLAPKFAGGLATDATTEIRHVTQSFACETHETPSLNVTTSTAPESRHLASSVIWEANCSTVIGSHPS